MKSNKISPFEFDLGAFRIPDNFESDQFNALTQKVQKLENWKIGMKETPENIYPLPKGYWLKMEESVRTKLSPKHNSFFFLKSYFSLNWVIGSLGVIIIGISLIFYPFQLNQKNNDWQAIIEQTTESELVEYVLDSQYNEKLETILMAKSDFPVNENGLPNIQISNDLIEKSLEDLSDFEELTY